MTTFGPNGWNEIISEANCAVERKEVKKAYCIT
jgi:hypothetical protein